MEFAIIVVAVIALIGFRLWLQHRRRLLIHRERLTAIEKGVELPQLDQDRVAITHGSNAFCY